MINELLVEFCPQFVRPIKDCDRVDRLNYYYTLWILTFLVMFMFGWSLFGIPIQCWFPAYYLPWWVQYALDYCYVQNTYFVPFTKIPVSNYWQLGEEMVHIPRNISHREDRLIGYYQWVPFMLALQTILFYIPVTIWRSLYEASGIKVKSICDICCGPENMNEKKRKENIDKISVFLDNSINVQQGIRGKKSFMVGRFLSSLFLFIKVLYLLNSVGQFFMLKSFLGLKSVWWGFQVLNDLAQGRDWPETGNFPRVNLCDYEVRVLGNKHRHTVQCVLMINMFNEKIFLFLYFWFIFITLCTLYSLLYWFLTTMVTEIGEQTIEKYICNFDHQVKRHSNRQKIIRKFIRDSLKPDGIFLIRLVCGNAGDVIASELLESLWNRFKKRNVDLLSPSPRPVTLAGNSTPHDIYPHLPFPPRYETMDRGEPIRSRKRTAPLKESGL